MLKNFNRVDWDALDAPKMPYWLEGMASRDIDLREKAYDDFYDSGVIELNKATPYVIPFLIELLSYQDTPRKDAMLQLLIVLASEALAYSDHPKKIEIAKAVLAEINKGKSVFKTYVEKGEAKDLAIELLDYVK